MDKPKKAARKSPSHQARNPVGSKEYHHGNLRTAVLKAAWTLVKKRGLRELTLREVARKVGVTHAAPYHHFRDRDALLTAMAEEAFAELAEAMRLGEQGITDPSERLFTCGRAYIDFARARPERVEVMFRRADKPSTPPTGTSAFDYLVQAIVACQEAGLAPGPDPLPVALSAWSLVHGFSVLWVEGPLCGMESYQENFEQLRDGMLRSFGVWLAAAAEAERAAKKV